MKTLLTMGLVFCATALFTPAQDSRAASRPDFSAEYEALESEFGEAMGAYYAPYEGVKTREEAAKIKLDPEKNPQKLMAAKFEDLGRRARGTPTGLRCLMWRMQGLQGPESDELKAKSVALLDELVADYLGLDELAEMVGGLGYYVRSVPAEKLAAVLARIEKDAKSPAARGSAMLLRASQLFESPDAAKKAEGRKLFAQVQKDYADTPAAARAKGQLYEAEHLQIDMTPEDITAKDENGVEFRLYDYRGKVTVVDFWGFW